jgi:hypothetical protein
MVDGKYGKHRRYERRLRLASLRGRLSGEEIPAFAERMDRITG